jgi:hypothetical protein
VCIIPPNIPPHVSVQIDEVERVTAEWRAGMDVVGGRWIRHDDEVQIGRRLQVPKRERMDEGASKIVIKIRSIAISFWMRCNRSNYEKDRLSP